VIWVGSDVLLLTQKSKTLNPGWAVSKIGGGGKGKKNWRCCARQFIAFKRCETFIILDPPHFFEADDAAADSRKCGTTIDLLCIEYH